MKELYITSHFIIGAAIGLVLVDPVLAFFGGCVSHALADMVPHHDPKEFIPGVLSVAPVLVIGPLLGSWGHGPAVLAGAIGGVIPDVEHVFAYLFPGDYRPIFPTHNGLLPHSRLDLPWGFLIQAAIMIALLLLLYHEAPSDEGRGPSGRQPSYIHSSRE